MGARERGQCPRETRVGGLSRALPRAFSNERMRHFWGPFHGLAARKAANAEEAALGTRKKHAKRRCVDAMSRMGGTAQHGQDGT